MTSLSRLSAALVLTAAVPFASHSAVIYDADFEGLTVGAALPTGLPPGLPSSIDPNLTATVENAASINPQASLMTGDFARLAESNGEAPDLQFDSGVTFTTGLVTVSMDLLFESLESHHVYFREGSGANPGGSSINMADITTFDDGSVRFESNGGVVGNATYDINETIHLETIFDLDANTWDAFFGGVQVVNDEAIFDEALGRVIIGFEFSGFNPEPTGQDGVMQIDNYRFVATGVPEPATALVVGLGLTAFGWRRRRAG